MYLVEWLRERFSKRREYRTMGLENAKRVKRAHENGCKPGHIAFAPGRPRPDSNINAIAAQLGLTTDGDLEDADVVFFWQRDGRSAFHEPPEELADLARTRRVVNIGASDISKTNVARVFEKVFGYPLMIDPQTHSGPAVEKTEGNGIRGGRMIECPTEPRPGFCYQRLVDNRLEGGDRTLDLRVAVYGDSAPFLIRKERSLDARFGNVIETHLTPTVHRPEDFLSEAEIRQVVGMALEIGADFCEIDCLRDRNSGRLYAVDVNTTPTWYDGFGPEAAEALVGIQAEAFEREFLSNDQAPV